jgi:hypothetical protein
MKTKTVNNRLHHNLNDAVPFMLLCYDNLKEKERLLLLLQKILAYNFRLNENKLWNVFSAILQKNCTDVTAHCKKTA